MITHINPVGSMDLLSQLEVDRLKQTASSDIYQLFRNCSLAVLNPAAIPTVPKRYWNVSNPSIFT